MFKNTFENLKKSLEEETPTERGQRMLPAAVYGALVATAYTLTYSFINVYTFPNLPLGMDWARMLGMWIGFGVALTLFGAVAAWFTEEYAGIVGGGMIFTALLAIVFLFSSRAQSSALTMQSLITALPLIGVNMLGAWGLRWAAHRHLAIKRDEEPSLRRKLLRRLIVTIILVGLVPGILGRMDLPSEQTIGQLHELLQAAPNDPSVWPRLPLKQVPELKNHYGVDYLLYPRQSALSVGALDVTIRFSDGYIMTCHLPVGSGSSFITECNEGNEVKTGSGF